mmetsp:Transcript_63347/g.169397  ORF Transcript_63347/g.169397 Transcript_63347/m.169397 type:complete len:208 (-) Transcript_63347:454-1077(-)
MPPPQPSVQEVQSAQSASLQSTLGSSFSGHGCACMRGPSQGFPPFSARAWTALVRYCWPVWLQPVLFQAVQSSSSQSWWHACTLHARVSSAAPQVAPPWSPARSTARVRIWSPPPHPFEHEENSDHSLISQSTGQGWSLHSTSVSRAGHAAPLEPSDVVLVITERVRVFLPVSPGLSVHDLEHSPSVQSPTRQSSTRLLLLLSTNSQ